MKPGRMSLTAAADALGICKRTLYRRIRPVRDHATRALWADRLDLRKKDSTGPIDVYHVCGERFAAWKDVLAGQDQRVV